MKNHRHSVNNPYAQFQDAYTLERVLEDRMIHHPLTRSQCSLTSDGAAAAVVVSEAFVREHGLESQARPWGQYVFHQELLDILGFPSVLLGQPGLSAL